jgi:flagellar biosynthesis protein FlhF
MNVKRFTAKTAREALALVRKALGDDAVVLSTRPSPDGVEVLALAPDGMARIEQAAAQVPVQRTPLAVPAEAHNPMLVTAQAPVRHTTLTERIAARGEKLLPRSEPRQDHRSDARLEPRLEDRREPSLDAVSAFGRGSDAGAPSRFDPSRSQALPDPMGDGSVARDVETLGMSTLTFQDYVRERVLKRRQAEISQQAAELPDRAQARQTAGAGSPSPAGSPSFTNNPAPLRMVGSDRRRDPPPVEPEVAEPRLHQALHSRISGSAPRREPPVLRDEVRFAAPGHHDLLNDDTLAATPAASAGSNLSASKRERSELMGELRSMRELIDERFGMLAFMERLQRNPRQATLSQKLLDVGLSPALVRKLVQSLPTDLAQAPDELAWAAGVLERNLRTDERELPLEDHDGVFALIGATGVGKTTSTAKLAAAFATRHGAGQLGLITLDAYRIAAHEQLRTYGRILGVPVHTAHDRASLEDLLELLAGKKLVLIDTAGMAQRDARTRELLDMLQHSAIKKLLVVNASAQGETIEDVLVAYGVQQCHGVIVSKLDEAVKLGPALDALIRYRAKVVGVANGQRVPEDWHRLSAQALVQRALCASGGASWRLDASEVNLMFAATQGAGYPAPQGGQARPLHA